MQSLGKPINGEAYQSKGDNRTDFDIRTYDTCTLCGLLS